MNYHEIGQRIRKERKKFNITREKLAELIDLSPSYVGQIERGERKMSLDTLIKISDCFRTSLDYIIRGNSVQYHPQEAILKEPNLADSYAKKAFSMAKLSSAAGAEDMHQLKSLIEKCSSREISLIIDLVKLLLPYLGAKK